MRTPADRFADYKWVYADKDPDALSQLTERIAQAGRQGRLITYSDLVRGVKFCISTVNGGNPFEIDPHDWSDLDRAIVGDFLGLISCQSYSSAKVFASALVVSKADGTPGPGFGQLMRDLGIVMSPSKDAELECWITEVQNAYRWYSGSTSST